ncbi:MAG TPA: hypothetical protein VI729_12160 [Anaerolineales bacterium]|nr:hypothetical protein [Anaerolineales bacterium]
MIALAGSPHRQAAVGYAGIGALVILITLFARLVPESRVNAVLELLIGLVFLSLFAVIIYRGWWPISAALVFSNSWRAFTYFNDGRGVHVELLARVITPIQPQPIAYLNAALMTLIVILLARSAIAGYAAWRAGRRA